MENFNWGEESVKELLSFIHNNKEANMLFWGNARLEDSSKPVRDAIIEQFKKSKEKKPLFTTEDGVKIYDGDYYCYVWSNHAISPAVATKLIPYRVDKLRFSTKEAAENYVLKNKTKPLFTTEDDKEIYKGNIYFYVDGNYNVAQRIASDDLMPGFIKFSTRDAAEKYVFENKPCLSFRDILNGYVLSDNEIAALVNRVGSKLKLNL